MDLPPACRGAFQIPEFGFSVAASERARQTPFVSSVARQATEDQPDTRQGFKLLCVYLTGCSVKQEGVGNSRPNSKTAIASLAFSVEYHGRRQGHRPIAHNLEISDAQKCVWGAFQPGRGATSSVCASGLGESRRCRLRDTQVPKESKVIRSTASKNIDVLTDIIVASKLEALSEK
jgi:hypothetical protein